MGKLDVELAAAGAALDVADAGSAKEGAGAGSVPTVAAAAGAVDAASAGALALAEVFWAGVGRCALGGAALGRYSGPV